MSHRIESFPLPTSRLLVLAGEASEADELLRALVERSRRESLEISLLVTARDAEAGSAERRLRATLARFRAAGLYVREAAVADSGPVAAAAEAVVSGELDEIVVAVPPRRFRRRGAWSVPERLRAATGLPVTPVTGSAPAAAPLPAALRRVGRARRRVPPATGRSLRLGTAQALAAIGLVLLGLAAADAATGDQPASGGSGPPAQHR